MPCPCKCFGCYCTCQRTCVCPEDPTHCEMCRNIRSKWEETQGINSKKPIEGQSLQTGQPSDIQQASTSKQASTSTNEGASISENELRFKDIDVENRTQFLNTPSAFPPDSFWLEQVKKIRSLYVPPDIPASGYKRTIQTIDYQKPDSYVLEPIYINPLFKSLKNDAKHAKEMGDPKSWTPPYQLPCMKFWENQMDILRNRPLPHSLKKKPSYSYEVQSSSNSLTTCKASSGAPSEDPAPLCAPSEDPAPVCAPSEDPAPVCSPSEDPAPVCSPSEDPAPVCSPSEDPAPVCSPSEDVGSF